MFRVDPVMKLAIIVAIGITITTLFGVGKSDEQIKQTIIQKSQTYTQQLPGMMKTGGFPLDSNMALNQEVGIQ